MMKEIWRDIKGYEGYYQVSNMGIIKGLNRIVNGKGSSSIMLNEKILKPQPNGDRYNFVVLCKKGKQKAQTVHRIVAITFISNPKNKKEVNHKNGIKTDNQVSNLEWCTHAENQKHAADNGLMARGEKQGRSKLTEADIREIRKLKKEGKEQKEIAKLFKISDPHVSDIVNSKSWTWLK